MIKFEKVSRLAAADFNLPVRKTKNSAGYDFEVAEDIIVPTFAKSWDTLIKSTPIPVEETFTLNEVASLTKSTKAKPTLVSTGVKCHLEEGYYLELSVRSSTPLKYWLVLANSVGIIDADYCDNPDNEGEIFFQIINLSPFPIQLHKGDIIGQGIIKRYEVTDDDNAEGERTGGFGSTSMIGTNSAQMAIDLTTAISRGVRANIGIYDEACNIDTEKCIKEAIMGKTIFDASM
jgi:dUTP pyrophosphatase